MITGITCGVIVGLLVGFVGYRVLSIILAKGAEKKIKDRLEEAKLEAEKITLAAREEAIRIKSQMGNEIQQQRIELKHLERRLLKKEDTLDKRAEAIHSKERSLENLVRNLERRQHGLADRERELDRVLAQEKQLLHQISGLSREEAIQMLLARLEPEIENEKALLIRKQLDEVQENVQQEARKLITLAIHRFAAEHTAGSVVSTIDIPNEEMKGRIIGREGRNIRTFERLTGVDVIVDDTPGVIVLSAFDGVRREIARCAMERLIQDGRIHPTRIEEVVAQTRKEIEESIIHIGKEFLHESGVQNVHPQLVVLMGKLRYRTSYGQNVLQHVREVIHICGVIAAELRLNPKLARRCGAFHDIGKAVDQEVEGSHHQIGAELLRQFNEPPEVIEAAGKHHDDPNGCSLYTIITAAADAISAARPGARGESLEKYLKRLGDLEAVARSFQGVESAYAIQAGRELRVIVNSEQLDDQKALLLARNIAQRIEKELTYPGEIRVTVLRETRAIEYAR
jgi:ribonuclease Y